MQKFSTVPLSDYSILSCQLDDLKFDSKCIINTVNQYSYVMAEKDQDFKDALSHSDVLLPDGIGIVAAVKFLNKQNIKKIAGADVHSYFLKKLDAAKGSCFYLGSSEETLVRIKKRSTRNILILGSILILRHSNQSSPRKIQIKWLRQ